MPTLKCDHVPYVALSNQVHCHGPEVGGQYVVTGCEGAAALEMPQDGDAHVGLIPPAQLGRHHFTDSSQPGHTANPFGSDGRR